MENLTSAAPLTPQYSAIQSRYNSDALVLESILPNTSDNSDASVVEIDRVSQTLSLSSDQILAKLNALLKDKLPAGIESLNVDDYTPEKTADSIVGSITALFANFQSSNPELSPEQQLSHFMAAARSGVDEGYSDAYETLDGLGAFSFDGVKSGIEQTKILITQKLTAFEAAQKKSLGIDSVQKPSAEITAEALLSQGGLRLAA
jgi:hypothetical protein